MSINYDWYQNPQKTEEGEEVKLHPRIHYNGSTTTAELRRYIQESSSLTEGDVDAVLSALSHFVSQEMGYGRSVHLDGLGYLSPVLGCTEPVTAKTKNKHLKVKLKKIRFRPDKTFMRRMGGINITCIRRNDPLEKRLTNDEMPEKTWYHNRSKKLLREGYYYGTQFQKQNRHHHRRSLRHGPSDEPVLGPRGRKRGHGRRQ